MGALAKGPLLQIAGRYLLFGEIAAGGMATVHLGRLSGPVGFSRTVAIKRLHPQYAKDPDFVSMFLDEARLAGRIRHPNVVPTLDVVATDGEIFLVMEYIQGESLSRLSRALRARGGALPIHVATTILVNVLHGLHAAHEATDEQGSPLNIVHRDVSPQNVLVGADGVARVLDFGVAKAAGRLQTTREGQIKGKIAYMSPEQLTGTPVDRATDVYAASVVLWELLTGQRLFEGENEAIVLMRALEGRVDAPSTVVPSVPKELDEIVMRGLSRERRGRFATARDMAVALEHAAPLASPREIGEWMERVAGEELEERARHVAEIESSSMAVQQRASSGMMSVGRGPAGSDHDSETITRAVQRSQIEAGTQISQVSSISVSRASIPATRTERGLRGRVAVGIGLFAMAAVLGVFLVRPHLAPHGTTSLGGHDAPNGATPLPPRAVDEPPAATHDGPPPPQPAPQTTPATPPSPAPAIVAEDTRPTKRAATSGAVAPAAAVSEHTRPSAASRPECNPAYTYDAAGRKHYKLDCL